MRLCTISGCNKKHEARGYCKIHYRSLLKWGNPLQVEINRLKQESKDKAPIKTHCRTNFSTKGNCIVDGCKNPIKARQLCEKHYARRLRNGNIQYKNIKYKTSKCLAFCDKLQASCGYCDNHYLIFRKTGTPFKPKIIRLCSINNCRNFHLAKGFCSNHYTKFAESEIRNPREIKLCGVDDCINLHYVNGLCLEHYLKWKKLLNENKLRV